MLLTFRSPSLRNLSFRRWRRSRPFWGGLTTIAAGAEIAAIPLAPLEVMVLQGVTGVVSVLMGLALVLMGLSAWFAPYYRGLAGVLAVLVAAGALVLSNLGGFFIGTTVGVIGGSLIFGWQPLPSPAEPDTRGAPAGAPAPATGDDPSGDPAPAPGAATGTTPAASPQEPQASSSP